MEKIGFVFDSSCGLTKKEASELNIGFIPLNISINGENYKIGINSNRDELYSSMQNRNTIIKTATPTGEDIENALKDILKKYEKAIYIGISYKFSGTQNAIKNIINANKEFKNRIFVFESEFSSPWTGLYIKDILELVKNYDKPEDFIKELERANKYMISYFTPGDIWWFYKGGRITKKQYFLGSIAKILPVLKFSNGEIDKSTAYKTRGREKAMNKMFDLIKEDVDNLNLPKEFYKFIALKTNNQDLLDELTLKMKEKLEINNDRIIIDHLSTEQIAHMGPNSFGIGLYISLKTIINGELK